MDRELQYKSRQEGPLRRSFAGVFGSREQRNRLPIERNEYFGHISRIVSDIRIAKGGYEGWWVVGSLAKAAVTENPFEHIRSDGSLRDIDVLFSYPNLPISKLLWRNNQTPIHIGTGMGNYIKIEPGKSAKLFFGPVEKEVPVEAFPTVMVNVGGVDFPTLPPETLFHLQAARPKWRDIDVSNMIDIAWYLRTHRGSSKYSESLYAPFHEYMEMLRDANIRRSISYRLKELGDRYQASALNKIFPINNPLIRRPLEEGWDLIGRTQRTFKGEKAERGERIADPHVVYEIPPRE